MSHRGRGPRCERCTLPPRVCFCADLIPIVAQTPIAVISHPRELGKPTSSGSFAALAISGLRVFVRGDPGIAAHVAGQRAAGRTPVLLFPHESAVPLETIPGPIALYASDGNWRQGRKVGMREPAFRGVVQARLPAPVDRARLRWNPRADRMATMEAIAYAMGILEGEAISAAILSAYDRFVSAVGVLRGWRTY